MSPRVADPQVRAGLVEAAARLLAEEGPVALSTRRVAAELGVSTMAVYTHFGGKEDLVRAIVWEGFERLAVALGQVETTEDPVADTTEQGIAYRANARANPHLYSVMFGGKAVPEFTPTQEDMLHGLATFATLVDAVQRCIDASRWDDDGAADMAAQLWAASHGLITLELNDFLGPEAEHHALDLCLRMAVGYGDDPVRAQASVRSATDRRRGA